MEEHITNVCRSADIEILRISNIRHYLTIDATKTLLCAFVLSKLDYRNSLRSGSPKHLLDKLRKVQNSAARLVFKALKHEHIWVKSQLCATILSLKVTQSIFLNS